MDSLDDRQYLDYVSFCDSINPTFTGYNETRLLFVDNINMGDFSIFKNQFENEYCSGYYSANSVVDFKLKINVQEYIMIQNILFPVLLE